MMSRSAVRIASVTVGTTAAASKEISLEQFAGGIVYIPTGETVVTLTYHTAPVACGTYLALYDEDGVAVTQTVSAAKAYAIPAAVWGCGFIKISGDAAATVDLYLKA